jgi:hypothetical protein
MRETWYVLEDGASGDPREVAPGKDGMLVHRDGRKVAYAPHGPRSRSVDVSPKPFGGKGDHDGDGKAGGAAKPKPDSVTTITADMEAEQPAPAKRGRPYKARDSKAD